MTFLPIVERELRVASRRKLTYWFRIVTAGFALIIFGALLYIWSRDKNIAAGVTIGFVQFSILEWMAFIFACGAGVFLTSDSLSEEKREGTLGLLFLTDLRGHDVVLGKLFSHSLQAFYGLLAAFPVLGLCLLLGGVTGAEFGRAILVICNTLFFSLAAGMFVSSISREVMKAMNGALLINLIFLLGLPWLDFMSTHGKTASFNCLLSIASPGHLFFCLKNMRAGDFWFQLGIQHSIAWLFLGAACLCVPRAWQEKASVATDPRISIFDRWRYGGRPSRLALRRNLLPKNPILWLAMRDRWMSRVAHATAFIAVGLLGLEMWLGTASTSKIASRQIASIGSGLFHLAIYLWVASQASRFFVEAIRSGGMELILVTPVTPGQVIRGQWQALVRTFFVPVILIIVMIVANAYQNLRAFPAMAGPSANLNFYTYYLITSAVNIINVVFSLVALGWFGMWMGVTTKKTSLAVLKAFVFVLILPWIAEMFVQIFSTFLFAFAWRNYGQIWLGLVLVCLVDSAKNVFFIFWSRRMLVDRLRDLVSKGDQSFTHRIPPPIPLDAVIAPPKVPTR